ncbi:MAG: hypothetical protein DRH50_04120 [Deltaproteobacteria bacterium]|nr:MAG: hypothetical protein DRH50_04120 [Deltaproteobacteria bacterium]
MTEVVSCAAGIGKSLEITLENGDEFARIARQVGQVDQKFGKKPKKKERQCPDCGATIYQADGCVICSNPEWGWSEC